MKIILDNIQYINVPMLTECEIDERMICALIDKRCDLLFYTKDFIADKNINKIKFSKKISNLEIYSNGVLIVKSFINELLDEVDLESNYIAHDDFVHIYFCY